MFKSMIRLLSFFNKEVNEIRRQPRLVLSLMLGPFLILLLFGAGYQGDRPRLLTALVVPESLDAARLDDITHAISANFELVSIGTDRATAMEQLQAGAIDVVQILPDDVEQRALSGQQSLVEFKYNEINPFNEQWIQYLAYAQVNEINRTILLQVTAQMQTESGTTLQLLNDVNTRLGAVESGMSVAQREDTQDTVRRLQESLDLLAASPLLIRQMSDNNTDVAQTQQEVQQLRNDLELIDQALERGDLEQQQDRITATRNRIRVLEANVELLSGLPPEVIVSPLQRNYENIRGASLDVMTYYAPSVIALILQHIAVTLGALSLVRERLLGALELYRVAPVSMLQILIGKYLGYTLFISFIVALLVALMHWGLNVPFLGSIAQFIGVVLLFMLAALGVGFLISTLSTSESQAVQLSMLVLLLSIFFSGFFLPLENFWAPIRTIGYMIPLTHGIDSFQAILLQGITPHSFSWVALSVIAAITFVIVTIISQIQFRRV